MILERIKRDGNLTISAKTQYLLGNMAVEIDKIKAAKKLTLNEQKIMVDQAVSDLKQRAKEKAQRFFR